MQSAPTTLTDPVQLELNSKFCWLDPMFHNRNCMCRAVQSKCFELHVDQNRCPKCIWVLKNNKVAQGTDGRCFKRFRVHPGKVHW